MQFISIYFIVFLAFSILGYNSVPRRFRYLFVLLCNGLFYASWISSLQEAIPLFSVTVLTWGGALLFQKSKRFTAIAVGTAACVLLLLYFKYADFLVKNINATLKKGGGFIIPPNPVAPIGISFFTFQAVGYIIDVYRGKVQPEKNPLRYAAYVSFFPTIASGPIERSDKLLRQLQDGQAHTTYDDLRRGMMLFVYGAFLKLVISDRISVIVNTVYGSYHNYGGAVLFLASIGYTIQIYCDFSSYSMLALGVAQCLGIQVQENFKAPYFALSIQEFWRRWHISLSTWFRDYVYISLGGNRCSKARKNLNLLITFLVSGLWHGANWTFIFWGLLHGMYQIVGNLTKNIRDKFIQAYRINTSCFSFRLWKRIVVFLLVSFAWIFFRSETILDAVGYIRHMCGHICLWQLTDGTLYGLGLSKLQMDILLLAFLMFVCLDVIKYRTDKNIDTLLLEQNALFRWIVVAGLIVSTMVFGMYGPAFNAQDFIYFQF